MRWGQVEIIAAVDRGPSIHEKPKRLTLVPEDPVAYASNSAENPKSNFHLSAFTTPSLDAARLDPVGPRVRTSRVQEGTAYLPHSRSGRTSHGKSKESKKAGAGEHANASEVDMVDANAR